MTPTDTAADAAITAACTELHLPTIRAEAGHLADQATKANASHRAYLAEVLCAEVNEIGPNAGASAGSTRPASPATSAWRTSTPPARRSPRR